MDRSSHNVWGRLCDGARGSASRSGASRPRRALPAGAWYGRAMKAALFCTSRYVGPTPDGVWPLPPKYCDPETAKQSMAITLEQFRLADVFGLDWVTVA